MTDVERWRPVLGFEGLYEVSSLGRVRSVARWVAARDGRRLVEGRVLTPSLGEYYLSVQLSDGVRVRHTHVHRIVAEAFVLGSGAVVRHLDGNPANNLPANLAWGSYLDNEADKARHGRVPKGLTHPRAVLTVEQVKSIRVLHARGHSQLKISAALGLNRGVVGCVVRGESYVDV